MNRLGCCFRITTEEQEREGKASPRAVSSQRSGLAVNECRSAQKAERSERGGR